MKKLLYIFIMFILGLFVFPATAHANHSWGNYHWARTSNPFTVKLGDNVSYQWDYYLSRHRYYWDRSTSFNASVVRGSTTGAACYPTYGQVQVCNAAYGETGWLGLAQLWVTGDHITAATVKLNDTYFNTSRFNTSAWRHFVMCQEIGHAFGLDHQDIIFDNNPLGTCMDYTTNPVPNQLPNTHDYNQLLTIYNGHIDSGTTVSAIAAAESGTSIAGGKNYNNKHEWGAVIQHGHTSIASGNNTHELYERDFGLGRKLRTDVIWVKKN